MLCKIVLKSTLGMLPVDSQQCSWQWYKANAMSVSHLNDTEVSDLGLHFP